MARHDLLADLFDEGVYFAHPGSPSARQQREHWTTAVYVVSPPTPSLRLKSTPRDLQSSLWASLCAVSSASSLSGALT
jgi:hypothetical protein